MSKENSLPGWISDLRPLAGVAGFLVALASDPAEALRDVILDVVLSFVLGGVVDVLGAVFGQFLAAFEQAAAVPGILAGALLSFGDSVGSTVLTLVFSVADLVRQLASSAGPFGPLLAFGVAAVVVYIAFESVAILVDTVFPVGGDLIRSVRGLFR